MAYQLHGMYLAASPSVSAAQLSLISYGCYFRLAWGLRLSARGLSVQEQRYVDMDLVNSGELHFDQGFGFSYLILGNWYKQAVVPTMKSKKHETLYSLNSPCCISQIFAMLSNTLSLLMAVIMASQTVSACNPPHPASHPTAPFVHCTPPTQFQPVVEDHY